MNSTNLAFVFSSGCLSTCRVPDGGTWGQNPKREVVSVISQNLGGHGEARGREPAVHLPTTSQEPLGTLCAESTLGLGHAYHRPCPGATAQSGDMK